MTSFSSPLSVVVASTNAGKLAELRAALPSVWRLGGISVSPEETGTTYEENARIKAYAALAAHPEAEAALADDSGLEVAALPDLLGVYSARFGGLDSDEEKNALLLEMLAEKQDREAKFVCVLALVFRDGREILARGEVAGQIAEQESGNGGFGYDPLFIPEGEERTFGEMTAAEKARYSHRSRALEVLLQEVKK